MPANLIHSLISGRPARPNDPTGGWEICAPYATDLKLGRAEFAYPQIDQTVTLARENQKKWAALKIEDRKLILLKALESVLKQKDSLLNEASVESGRPRHEMEREWTELSNWIEGFKKATFAEKDPRGVVAYIGSYVWPLYHSTHFSVLSLLMGNAVVIKPSEKTIMSVIRWAQAFLSAESGGMLDSVLHVLVGEKEFSRRLACHDQVGAVIFMGSYEGGIRIRQDTLHQTQKEILLYLGAKNASIIGPDAPAPAMTTLIEDVFLGAGQHCKNISQIFIHESGWEQWIQAFHEGAKMFKIGAPDTDAWMGPLIDESLVDRYLKFAGISEREGAKIIMRGKSLVAGKKAFLVTPTIAAFDAITADQVKKSVTFQSEIFAPHVSLVRYQDDAEVIRLCNQSHYGLCASVWSQSAEHAREIAKQLEVGEVRINSSTLQYAADCSFQPKKKSGNHAFHGFALWEQLGLSKSIK